MFKTDAVTSRFVLSTLAVLALSGCGKGDEKSGAAPATMQSVSDPGHATLRPGECTDIIGTPSAKEITAFSNIAETQGKFELVGFHAVGMKRYDVEASSREGISVIAGKVLSSGAVEVSPLCDNLDQMPNEQIQWKVTAPVSINAKNGQIHSNFTAQQIVFGRNIVDASGNRRISPPSAPVAAAVECLSADSAMASENCSGTTQYYKFENGTIGVLHVMESRDVSGAIVTGKVIATYALKGAPASENPAPVPAPTKKKIGQGGKTGQGGTGQGGVVGQGGKNNSGANATPNEPDASNSNANGNANAEANSNAKTGKTGKIGQGGIAQGGTGQGGVVVTSSKPTVIVVTQSAPTAPIPSKPPVVVSSETGDVQEASSKIKVKEVTGENGEVEKSKVKIKTEETTVAKDGTVTESKSKLKDKKNKRVSKHKLKTKTEKKTEDSAQE